jgi:hypothetical protein
VRVDSVDRQLATALRRYSRCGHMSLRAIGSNRGLLNAFYRDGRRKVVFRELQVGHRVGELQRSSISTGVWYGWLSDHRLWAGKWGVGHSPTPGFKAAETFAFYRYAG